ncbi:hypothetical protein [Yinghuangia sp. YIM S09857]|uniref:hypothetical protein n=1 Tax=Yinghuangia sp. YIM S09857 TaxID=3436929 RepID=UPI003F53C9CD
MGLTRITLASRRGIELAELRMSSTYGGMLEGVPTKRVNERLVAARLRIAGNTFSHWPVHLIPPVSTPRGTMTVRDEPIEELPRVACLGAFTSYEIDPAHNTGWYFSALVVVWFQDTPTPPSDESAPEALRNLPWEKLARDLEH